MERAREHKNAIGKRVRVVFALRISVTHRPKLRKLTLPRIFRGANEEMNRKEWMEEVRRRRKRKGKKTVHKNKYHLYLTHEKVHWSNSFRVSLWIFHFNSTIWNVQSHWNLSHHPLTHIHTPSWFFSSRFWFSVCVPTEIQCSLYLRSERAYVCVCIGKYKSKLTLFSTF